MAKPLEKLTIVDDFMFGAVMSNPKRCKPLLELVLGVRIRRIEYPELQKTIDQRYGSKSIRLDVYVEDDEGTVYDVEIQTTSKKNLPKRTRYYQGIIDINILEKGEDYRALKRSFVIFICTYDPFGKRRYVYTFENRCKEDLSISLGDEATKIILNTKGTVGEISDELKSLLCFMDGMEPESDYTKDLEKAVDEVKADERWRREYMVMNELVREKVRLGRYSQTVAAVRRGRGKYSSEAIADLMMVDPYTVDMISAAIDAHPEWDDEEVAESLDFD